MKLVRRVVSYEEVNYRPEEVVPITEAARLLGMSNQGVVSAIGRGRLIELIDVEARNPRRFRRFLLRAEVEELAKQAAAD